MSLIGCTVYRSGGDVLHNLSLLQPHFVVVGSGAWNDIDAIAGACNVSPAKVEPLIIMRDMRNDLLSQPPEQVIDNMDIIARQLYYKKVAFHLLNESYSDAPRAATWERRAIFTARPLNRPTVALNLAYGNDLAPEFREIAELSTFNGPHLYDGFEESKGQFVDRIYTSRRYLGWPSWWDRSKHISTEIGIEAFPSPGHPKGWIDIGLSEELVTQRMLENAGLWKQDGLLGVCWFTLAD
jgi:hypothetical protein